MFDEELSEPAQDRIQWFTEDLAFLYSLWSVVTTRSTALWAGVEVVTAY